MTREQPSDEELAVRARRGESEAFAALVSAHQSRMYSLALRLLRDPDDAADAAQEAFVRCYTSLASFDHRRSFGAWLYRIGYNLCLDMLRARKRAAAARVYGERNEESVIRAPDPGPGIEEVVEREETVQRVSTAVDHLSEDHRHILTLKYTLDLSYQEIAEVLNLPESTVTMRLHHAKTALRKQLGTGAEEGERDAAS